MKSIFITLLSVLSLSMFAQKEITVQVETVTMSKGTQTSYQVTIPQNTFKDVEKDWQKYTGTGSKGKASAVKGENFQPAAVNANVSPAPFNVYSKLLETTEGVRLTVWLTENDTIFISKEVSSDKDLAAQKYVRDFAVQEYQNVVKKELEAEQEKQKELEKELQGFIKDEEKSRKKISSNQRSIQRANDAIATNNADIQNTAYKITDSKRMVERTASDENANKGAKKSLKEVEKNKKKLQKDNESQAKNIDKWNKEIREEERNITDSQQKQAAKKGDIEKQKQKVQEVQTKLDGIK